MTRGRSVGLILACFIFAASWASAAGKFIVSRTVVCTTTVGHVVAAMPNRTSLLVQNVGTLHVNVGGPALIATPLTTAGFNGVTLHVNASLSLTDYQGGLLCQTQPGTGSSMVEVIEVVQ